MIVTTSGLVDGYTGIGVIQRMLYPLMPERDIELAVRPDRDRGSKPLQRLAGVAVALSPPRPSTPHFSVVSPVPVLLNSPLATMVMDLQWLRTRGKVAASYRAGDLKRTVRLSRVLFVISARVGEDLIEYAPRCADRVRVIRLGPGQVPRIAFGTKTLGSLIFVGKAPHKRNELAASALCATKPSWVNEVTLISVSQQVQDIFASQWPELTVNAHSGVSTEQLIQHLSAAEFYIHLGVEEGFGLPFLEALNTGCQVIAIEQPVVEEVLGNAAIKISDGTVGSIGEQLAGISPVSEELRRAVASTYSWSACADEIAEGLREAFV